eukprot:9410302-Pyramimonas_sp.AAC.1
MAERIHMRRLTAAAQAESRGEPRTAPHELARRFNSTLRGLSHRGEVKARAEREVLAARAPAGIPSRGG